ncbi:MAG: DUF177 domain-containing protein [Polyangiaceae bacterium]
MAAEVHEFPISVADIDAGGKAFTFPIRAVWVRGVLEDHTATTTGKEGKIDVRVSRSGNDIVVHGTLAAELETPCVRCLEPVVFKVEKEIGVMAVPAGELKVEAEDYEFAAEEADLLPYEGETIVLDDFIRDELVLETPMTPLCSEDCPGMTHGSSASEPEAEASIDPRLLPLLRLKKSGKVAKE